MGAKKMILKIVLSILLISCLFSLFSFLYFTYRLDIKKVILKQGNFKLLSMPHEFNFNKLTNDRYNIVLRFYQPTKIEPGFIVRLLSKKVEYLIDIELRDKDGNLLKKEIIKPDSQTSGIGSREYFDWHLLFFSGERAQEYNLKISFQSDEPFFDKVTKEIYIEEDYDRPSAVWWYLFQRVFLIIFIITFLPSLIIGIFFWRKKRK